MTIRQAAEQISAALRGRRKVRPGGWLPFLAALSVGGAGCRDAVGTAALPPGTQSPTTYNTPEGALAMYRTTKAQSSLALHAALITSGALTDELLYADVGTGPRSIGALGNFIDERVLSEGQANDATYAALHTLRGFASQTIGLLQHYAPTASPALRGEIYALEGYAELQLAELYCSGVPLSTLDFEKDFTYRPSSTTQEVLQHAVALEDTALALSGDSARALNLARVLQGRALLALGRYQEAAQAVAAVPDIFQYDVPVRFVRTDTNNTGSQNSGTPLAFLNWTVADTEGTNGLPFVSGGDPRVRVSPATPVDTNGYGRRLFTPDKYPLNVLTLVPLASGVEARLIEAEAALHGVSTGRGDWLTILNALRTTGTMTTVPASTVLDTLGVTGCPNADGTPCGAGPGGSTPDFGQPTGYAPAAPGSGYVLTGSTTTPGADALIISTPDGEVSAWSYCNAHSWYNPCWQDNQLVVLTYVRSASSTWDAGTGGVAGLAPLSDPGSDSARVSLLFRERAYWLFLTGHRQGDLRRLVRSTSEGGYGRLQDEMYPTGPYYGGEGIYGSDVTLPIPDEERINPLFHGCFDREA